MEKGSAAEAQSPRRAVGAERENTQQDETAENEIEPSQLHIGR